MPRTDLLSIMRRPAALVGTCLLWLLPISAATAQPRIPVTNFQPAPATNNVFVTEFGSTLPHLTPSAAFLLSYAHRPLDVRDTNKDTVAAEIVRYQVNLDLMIAFGLWNRLELGLVLPVTLAQGSGDLTVIGRSDSLGAGIGDLRISPKGRIATVGPVTFGLALPVSIPTGSKDNFLGAEGVMFAPRAIIALDLPWFSTALNVSVRIRQDQTAQLAGSAQQVAIGNELLASLGARVPVWKKKIDLLGDLFFEMPFREQNREEVPLELLLGARLHLPYGLLASVGAGPGLTRGVGTPIVRVLAGLGWQYERRATPAVTDKDSDGDGILDSKDKCPNEPEDKDGFEDEDGCPDPDNDKDGICDPWVQEKGLSAKYEKVCKGSDRCPNEPEDKDGFEDEDGCPDPDNDKDGICDPWVQEKGLSAKYEKVCKGSDKCPNEPETFNGVDDDDGCPDQSKGPVQITGGKITVPAVYFATNKDVILKRSFETLESVAKTLKDNPWIKRVRIEGHTDSRGRDAKNLDLSKRRAASVMKFLAERGVETERLEAEGYGRTRPIADNKTKAGREKNRRVEFVILDPSQKATE
jgi:large repetitive protein